MSQRHSIPVLDETQLSAYWRDGYLLLPGLLEPAACAAVVAAGQRVRLEQDFWTPRSFDPARPDEDRDIHRLLVHPAITGVAAQLLRAPPRVLWGMLAVVPAGGGRGLPWHQDNQYEVIQGRALNLFIALCDIPPERCNLWVAPGSHRRGVLPSTYEAGHHRTAEPANGMCLPALKTGDVCVFDRNTLHRSLKNETDQHRYAYASQYMEEHARSEQGGLMPHRPLAADLARRWQSAAAA